jgi:hypothetical protein
VSTVVIKIKKKVSAECDEGSVLGSEESKTKKTCEAEGKGANASILEVSCHFGKVWLEVCAALDVGCRTQALCDTGA